MSDQSNFDAGHQAGLNAGVPLSSFDMSQYVDEFKVGYVVALAEVHSVRCASPMAAGVEAAEMGRKYRIPYESLAPYFDDPENPEVLDALRRGYGLEDNDDDYLDE
jgi:hypothetical protein